MAFLQRIKSWFFFINRRNMKRPIFWLSFLGLVFVVGLILFVPFYITSQNQYCSTCHAMEKYYKTWEASTHGDSDCVQCHMEPGLSNYYYQFVRTNRELYTNLIGETGKSKNYKPPTNELCFTCHTEYREASPSGDLLIPHRAHIKIRNLACIDCHKSLVHFKNVEGRNAPSMTICYKCHDGKRATNECTACHTKKAIPSSHRESDFKEGHGALAETQGKECAKCHEWTPGYCTECHLKRPVSHGGIEYRTYHKDQAKVREKGCYVCHGKSFCKNCHD